MRKYTEKIMGAVFFICALTSILAVLLICVFLFANGIPAMGKVGLFKFLAGTNWAPTDNPASFGIFPMILGSIYVTAGAIIIGVPIGLLTAVFMARYCPKPLYKILKPATELLAGIPSVLYGAFGLGVIVPIIKKISPMVQGQSMLAVILVLTIMILPTIVQLSETSLRAVPKSYREASYGLGGSKIQTIFKVTIPAAKSGILSAAVLGIGRAIGETMAVMMIAGNPTSGLPKSIWSMVRPLTTNIAMEMSYASGRQAEMLFATGVVLFIFIMIVNTTLIMLTHKAGETK